MVRVRVTFDKCFNWELALGTDAIKDCATTFLVDVVGHGSAAELIVFITFSDIRMTMK